MTGIVQRLCAQDDSKKAVVSGRLSVVSKAEADASLARDDKSSWEAAGCNLESSAALPAVTLDDN
jgi:hypothetical protein